MWKRETKLGLVVSGTFLCLLGTVVGKKLLYPEAVPAPTGEEATVAQGPTPPAANSPTDPRDGKGSEPKKFPLPSDPDGIKPISMVIPNPAPGAENFDDRLKKAAQKAGLGGNSGTTGDVAALPPVAPPVSADDPPLPNSNLNSAPQPKNVVLADPPPAPVVEAGKVTPPASPNTEAGKVTPPAPPPSGADSGLPGALSQPGSPVATPVPPGVAPPVPPGDKLLPTPPETATNPGTGKPNTTMPSIPPASEVIPLAPAPDTNKKKFHGTQDTPPAPVQKPELGPPTAVPPVAPPVAPPIPVGDLGKSVTPMPPIKVGDFPEPQGQPGSKVGNTQPQLAPGVVPVITVPDNPVPGAKKVKDYFVQKYQCEPDALTFPAISTKIYGSPKFGDALLQFNRDHPAATAAIQQNPPQLQPGTVVYLPPAFVLQEKYPGFFKSQSSVAPPDNVKPPVIAKTPGPASVPLPGAAPVTGIPIQVNQPQALGSIQQTPSGPVYVVKGDNEMILEIAQKTGFQWSAIYRLNPNVNPSYRIPPGTQLLLPSAKSQ